MFNSGQEFENEVRRIARLLWPSAEFDGAAMEQGRERDGIFETDEFVHVLECTLLRSKAKAEQDAAKIAGLLRRLIPRNPTKFLKGWFVTQDEPTADQRAAVKHVAQRHGLQIVTLSFDQFRSRLIDARSYLDLRKYYPFGSVRDPVSGKHQFDPKYVPMQVLSADGSQLEMSEIADGLLGGDKFVILGDYGAGKSATLREIYLILARRFADNRTLSFPLLLNMRDHHGQTDPVEALERHARKVGFPRPPDLVRAWRAGFVTLLLDGFDEIATAGWAGKTQSLKELRFRSMELLRAFVRDSTMLRGVAIAGREHFFDNEREMRGALAISASYRVVHLSEFNEQQVREFLRRFGWEDVIPAWLPTRPLLLAYLGAQNLLQPALGADAQVDPAAGWTDLIDRVAHREAELEPGVDPETIRHLIEHLAMIARNSVDGLGPLAPDVIVDAFRSVCGYQPDDRGVVLLQRLPGLGAHNLEDGSRVFIDRDFVEAARGGGVFRVIENPYGANYDSEHWQSAVEPLGAEVAACRASSAGYKRGRLPSAIRHLADNPRTHTLTADLLLVLIERGESYDEAPLFVREVIVPELSLEDPECDLGQVEFQDSVIAHLRIASGVPSDRVPRFQSCHFGRIDGCVGERDLPAGRFHECTYDEFESPARTTTAIMDLALPLGTKVVLTILKKLYAQGGAGRKETAFFRGLDGRAQHVVPAALALLRTEGLAARSSRGTEQIWLATRTGEPRKRALSMLAAPHTSTDPLLRASRDLG